MGSCLSRDALCPSSGDTDNVLLQKILQSLNAGGGGGGAGVSSINFNGSGAQTGAVSFSAVTSVNGDAGPAVVLTTTNVAEGANQYFTEARVLATVLTGFASALGAITAADSVLSAFGKTQGRLAALEAGTAGPFLLKAGDTGTGAFLFTPSGNDVIPLTLTSTAGSATTSNLFVANAGATNRVTLRNDGRLVLIGRASFADQASGLGHVFSVSDANTATSVLVASITHTLSAGVGANGIGAIIDWNLDSSTTAATRAARWSTIWSDATHATRNAVTTLNAFVAGTETPQLVIGSNQIGGPPGVVGAPGWVNRNDTTTGTWYPAASTIAQSLGGVEKTRLDTTGFGINITPIIELTVASTSGADPRGIMSAQYSADTEGARLHFRKSRGVTAGTNTVVQSGDVIGRMIFRGCDNAGNYIANGGASIRAVVTGTVAATRIASSLIFATATDAAPSVLTDRLTIDNLGTSTLNAAATATYVADFQVAGVTKVGVEVAGVVIMRGASGASPGMNAAITGDTSSRIAFALDSSNAAFLAMGSGSAVRDVILRRDAAAVLALSNTTVAAQTFRVYETTDSGLANYGRLSFQTQAGNYLIRTEMAGTTLSGGSAGTPRILQVGTGPSNGTNIAGANIILHSGQPTGSGVPGAILFQQALPVGGSGSGITALATTWQISTAGHFLAGIDNIYDVGNDLATRPRNGFFAGQMDIQNGTIALKLGADSSASTRTNNATKDCRVGSAHYTNAEEPCAMFLISSQSALTGLNVGGGSSQLNAVTHIALWTAATTTTVTGTERLRIDSAGIVSFGGQTSSFPALKRSSAQLHCRLADDSADAVFQALQLNVAGTKVVGAQGAAVADASGGAVIDAEARTALNDLLARLRTHGLIAT